MNVAWSARKVAADAAAVCYLFEWIFDAVFPLFFSKSLKPVDTPLTDPCHISNLLQQGVSVSQ